MRPAPCVLALLVVTFPVAPRAAQLAPAQFTQRFAARLRAAAPELAATVVRDLQVRVVGKDRREQTVFLDNAFTDYQRAPADLDAILAARVASARALVAGAASAPQRSRIVPLVKDRAWLAEMQRALRERGARDATAIAQVWEEYNPELLVFYAEDQPKNVRYLSEKDLRSAGVERNELRALAVRNLLSIVPRIELHGRDGVFMVTAGGVYEASLILADDLWDGGQVKVDGDVVVAIPARDLLLVCGSRDATALAKLRQIAANATGESSYPLTSALFVRRGGKFRRLD